MASPEIQWRISFSNHNISLLEGYYSFKGLLCYLLLKFVKTGSRRIHLIRCYLLFNNFGDRQYWQRAVTHGASPRGSLFVLLYQSYFSKSDREHLSTFLWLKWHRKQLNNIWLGLYWQCRCQVLHPQHPSIREVLSCGYLDFDLLLLYYSWHCN